LIGAKVRKGNISTRDFSFFQGKGLDIANKYFYLKSQLSKNQNFEQKNKHLKRIFTLSAKR